MPISLAAIEDLAMLSQNLLKPLREVTDEMESIALFELSGLYDLYDNEGDHDDTEETVSKRGYD